MSKLGCYPELTVPAQQCRLTTNTHPGPFATCQAEATSPFCSLAKQFYQHQSLLNTFSIKYLSLHLLIQVLFSYFCFCKTLKRMQKIIQLSLMDLMNVLENLNEYKSVVQRIQKVDYWTQILLCIYFNPLLASSITSLEDSLLFDSSLIFYERRLAVVQLWILASLKTH